MFEFKQLQCFVAVSEELNFRRAASRMHMTQPPLSRQIRLLEHEMQVQLFARTSRSVELTPAGSSFLPEARRLLALAANAAISAQRIARGESGLMNLGFTAGSSYSFLPKLLALTNAHLKDIDIVLHEMMTRDQIESLRTHAIDVSVLRRIFEAPNIGVACVARETMMLAVPHGHRFAKGHMPTINELKGEPFITFSPVDGPYFYELVERIFSNADVPTRYVQRLGQIHSILALVSAGQGIALVPESARALHFDRVVIRKVKMSPVYAELYLAWAKDNPNPALPLFRKVVLAQMASSFKEPGSAGSQKR
jgi:DNA-binding transcriptional LysR family regulator